MAIRMATRRALGVLEVLGGAGGFGDGTMGWVALPDRPGRPDRPVELHVVKVIAAPILGSGRSMPGKAGAGLGLAIGAKLGDAQLAIGWPGPCPDQARPDMGLWCCTHGQLQLGA